MSASYAIAWAENVINIKQPFLLSTPFVPGNRARSQENEAKENLLVRIKEEKFRGATFAAAIQQYMCTIKSKVLKTQKSKRTNEWMIEEKKKEIRQV